LLAKIGKMRLLTAYKRLTSFSYSSFCHYKTLIQINKTEELRLLLEGAKGTSGHDRFASRAARCEAALSELEERIKVLSTVQRKWIYLDPVYGGEAAPNDSGRWSRADKEFRFVIIRLILIRFNVI
jgi:hypothetical protein